MSEAAVALPSQATLPSTAGVHHCAAMTVVTVERLVKTYDTGARSVAALAGVDLQVERGDFVAIMGRSGSGKSTLLHMIGGLQAPTSGRVVIDGVELATLSDAGRTELRRKKIGLVFQRFNLLPTLTVAANLRVASWVYRQDAEVARRQHDLLESLGIADRVSHRPCELSGGEQQRVAIARALLHRPALLLADEPTGNLDTHSATHVLELLRGLADRLQQTIIMITHDPEAAAYASRIVRMRDGRIVHD